MREKGKEYGILLDKLPSNFNNEKFDDYKVLFGHYILPKTMQITKMTIAVNYYEGNLGRKHKKEVKRSKEKRQEHKISHCKISHCKILLCEIF